MASWKKGALLVYPIPYDLTQTWPAAPLSCKSTSSRATLVVKCAWDSSILEPSYSNVTYTKVCALRKWIHCSQKQENLGGSDIFFVIFVEEKLVKMQQQNQKTMFSNQSREHCQSRFYKEWNPDYIAAYNSLEDKNLKHYFNHPARRNHLTRNQLVSLCLDP